MDTLRIAPAGTHHIAAMLAVGARAWLATYPHPAAGITTADVAAELTQPAHRYCVALRDGRVVGYDHAVRHAGAAELVELYVLPEQHGQGIGGRLLREVLAWCEADQPLRLEVAAYSRHAIAISTHYGFTTVPDARRSPDDDWNVLPSGARIPFIVMERPPGSAGRVADAEV